MYALSGGGMSKQMKAAVPGVTSAVPEGVVVGMLAGTGAGVAAGVAVGVALGSIATAGLLAGVAVGIAGVVLNGTVGVEAAEGEVTDGEALEVLELGAELVSGDELEAGRVLLFAAGVAGGVMAGLAITVGVGVDGVTGAAPDVVANGIPAELKRGVFWKDGTDEGVRDCPIGGVVASGAAVVGVGPGTAVVEAMLDPDGNPMRVATIGVGASGAEPTDVAVTGLARPGLQGAGVP